LKYEEFSLKSREFSLNNQEFSLKSREFSFKSEEFSFNDKEFSSEPAEFSFLSMESLLYDSKNVSTVGERLPAIEKTSGTYKYKGQNWVQTICDSKCGIGKPIPYTITSRQAATKKSRLALKLQITKYKLQTNYKPQNTKKMAVILGYLKCSLKEVFQDATKNFLLKKQQIEI